MFYRSIVFKSTQTNSCYVDRSQDNTTVCGVTIHYFEHEGHFEGHKFNWGQNVGFYFRDDLNSMLVHLFKSVKILRLYQVLAEI